MKLRDLQGVFPDVKTQDMGLHPVVLEGQTEDIWPRSWGGRMQREGTKFCVRHFGAQVRYLQRG